MRATIGGVALVVVCWAARAGAQPGATGPTVPPPGEPVPTVEAGIREDANSGRTWLSPTALTPPAGTFSIQSTEVLVIGASYSFTDRLVVSANTFLPVGDMPPVLLTTIKLKVADRERVKLAAHANVNYFDFADEEDDESFGAAIVGGVATYCLDPDCHSIFNGYVGAGFLLRSEIDQQAVPILVSAALVLGMSSRVKLVVEVNSALLVGDVNDRAEGLLAWYGLRFTSSAIGVDLGMVKPFCDDCETDELPLGLPWLNFSFRL